ncbi:MAG: hypothetical protein KA248_04000 [Kiritimatiellae bacterium]|nr:hypothetical protein [Kiritimatiellia bacterium]
MNWYDVKRAAGVAGLMVLGAGLLFALLIGSSLGWFERSRGAPARPAAPAVRPSASVPRPGPAAAEPTASYTPASVRAASDREADPRATRLRELELENRRLNGEVQDLRGRLVGVLNWVLTNFKGTYPLPETFMARLQVPPVTEDFTLHPEAAALIKVTPEEEQKINDIFAYARSYLAEIEAAMLTVTSPRPDKVILHIPPFAEDGAALREDMYAAMEITLGPDRFDRFIKVSEAGLKSSFYRFGEASRTLVFELVYAGAGEPPRLKIKDGWIMETAPGGKEITAVESTVTNLPAGYAAYSPWLPDTLVQGFMGGAVR